MFTGKTDLPEEKKGWYGLRLHPRALLLAIVIAGIAPLFGFTAIALGLVGYVTALFKLGAVFTIVWVWLLLGISSDPLEREIGIQHQKRGSQPLCLVGRARDVSP